MSTQRYSETRILRDDTRRGNNDGYDVSFGRRVSIPIENPSRNFQPTANQQHVQERILHQDTTIKWVNDPISGKEKFRVTINIDGFNQNEVNIRVDGNKLIVNGEHIENKNQDTAKKIIEKSYELPHDIDKHSPHVTFPTAITMQVDFPSRHSNVVYDDGRISSKLIPNLDISRHTPPRFTEERSSSEFTSTRKIGGTGVGSTYERSSSPRPYSSYKELQTGPSTSRGGAYTTSNQYPSNEYSKPSFRGSPDLTNYPSYTYKATGNEPTTNLPYSSLRGDTGRVTENTYTEIHRETQHRRSSPTTGTQSSREVEHHRSGSPSIARTLDEDRFRPNIHIGHNSVIPPLSSRNVEVREYSRRVGGHSPNNVSEAPLFAQNFNSDAFYRSAFQPQIITDERGQKCVEMKLDANNYQPSEIKISVNANDLIVQAEHNDERPPTSSSRAYFYKQITLPPNTDLNSITSNYHPDGKLHITAKLFNEQGSLKYN